MEFDRDDVAIAVDNVSIHFNMSSEKVDSLKEYFIKLAKRQLFFKKFVALENVSILKFSNIQNLMILGKLPFFSNLIFETVSCFLKKGQNKFILHI